MDIHSILSDVKEPHGHVSYGYVSQGYVSHQVYEFQIRCPCVLKEHKIISFAKMGHLLYDLISCTSLAGINIRMLFLYE